MAFIPNPRMFYIGMQDQFFTFNMFDVQAWWARDVILGDISVPASKEEMYAQSKPWEDKEALLASDEDLIRFQAVYTEGLMKQTDYPNFDIEGVVQLFLQWEHHKHEDIMGFRNNSYKSVMTGTQNPVHHTAWKDCMDDSITGYVGK